MQIIERKINELIQAEYNPRELTKEQYTKLKDSLQRFGLVDPILINTNKERENIIIGGHQRTRVWSDLGNKTINCIELDLTLEREKELNIRLNKNTGQFDHDLLSSYFDTDELIEWGFVEEDFFNVDVESLDDEFVLNNEDKTDFEQKTFILSSMQSELIDSSIKAIQKEDEFKFCKFDNENKNGNALYYLFLKWDELKK